MKKKKGFGMHACSIAQSEKTKDFNQLDHTASLPASDSSAAC